MRGLGKHYHLLLDPKLKNGKCAIYQIPCACIAYTTMLDKTWDYKVDPNKHRRYEPVVEFTYWHVLGSFINSNIIKFNNKTTSSENFDAVHEIVLDEISDTMISTVELGKYGAINAVDTPAMGYYVINYLSELYTLQEYQTIDGK